MTHWVVGFAFSPARDRILLIMKNSPVQLKGKLNGIGGHVKPGELSSIAMSREFKEETGIATRPTDWKHVGIMHGDKGWEGKPWRVDVFKMMFKEMPTTPLKSTPEGVVGWWLTSLVPNFSDIVRNLGWLVPLCADPRLSEIWFKVSYGTETP